MGHPERIDGAVEGFHVDRVATLRLSVQTIWRRSGVSGTSGDEALSPNNVIRAHAILMDRWHL